METKFVKSVKNYRTTETKLQSTCCWTMEQAITDGTISQRGDDLFIKGFEAAFYDWKGLKYCPWCGNQIEVKIYHG